MYRLGIVALSLSCFCVSAQEPVQVGLTHIPKVLEYGTPTAPYNKLIKAISKDVSVAVEYDYMPSERGNKLLGKGKLDCIFPILPANYQRAEQTRFSAPVNGVALYLFSLQQPFTKLTDLDGQIVVHLRGYLFANERQRHPNIKFFPASNQLNAFEMLKNGRAAAYMDYLPDIQFSIPKEYMTKLNYDPYSPILVANDSFECKDAGAAKQYLQQVERSINKLRASGELEKILGDYYLPVTTK